MGHNRCARCHARLTDGEWALSGVCDPCRVAREAHDVKGRTNYCEQCLRWLEDDEVALCDTCAADMKASAAPQGPAVPGMTDGEMRKFREAASRLMDEKIAMASAAQMGKSGEGAAPHLTYEHLRRELEREQSTQRKHALMKQMINGGFEHRGDVGRGLPSNVANQITVYRDYAGRLSYSTDRKGPDPSFDLLACVYNALAHCSENSEALTSEPWFNEGLVATYVEVPATVHYIDNKAFQDAVADLTNLGLIQRSPDAAQIRLLNNSHDLRAWEDAQYGKGRDLEGLRGLRERVVEAADVLRHNPPKRKDPTPWRYNGASEEALLAVEAMQSDFQAMVGVVDSTVDTEVRRIYRVTERADHRPFEVIFDAEGGEVPQEMTDKARWDPVPYSANMIIKDMLAALCVKLERASEAWFCRGCGELDPEDMHFDEDALAQFHVVLGQDHDPNDPHIDGECRSCPIQVEQQCGPLVKVGGA